MNIGKNHFNNKDLNNSDYKIYGPNIIDLPKRMPNLIKDYCHKSTYIFETDIKRNKFLSTEQNTSVSSNHIPSFIQYGCHCICHRIKLVNDIIAISSNCCNCPCHYCPNGNNFEVKKFYVTRTCRSTEHEYYLDNKCNQFRNRRYFDEDKNFFTSNYFDNGCSNIESDYSFSTKKGFLDKTKKILNQIIIQLIIALVNIKRE